MNLSILPIDDLITLFGNEWDKYFRLVEDLTFKESRKSKNRKDFSQKEICNALRDEISSRPLEQRLRLKELLNDPRPAVKLSAAFALEDIALNDAVNAYRELSLRPNRSSGLSDIYAARALMSLDRIEEARR